MVSDQIQIKRNEELVKHEIYCCVTPMVEYILSMHDTPNSPFCWDDVENLYTNSCAECGANQEGHDEEAENNDMVPHDFENNAQEIYEYWAVSPWLFAELKKRGEPVIDTFPHIWGRTCTGEAIALDYVITKIQRDNQYGQL